MGRLRQCPQAPIPPQWANPVILLLHHPPATTPQGGPTRHLPVFDILPAVQSGIPSLKGYMVAPLDSDGFLLRCQTPAHWSCSRLHGRLASPARRGCCGRHSRLGGAQCHRLNTSRYGQTRHSFRPCAHGRTGWGGGLPSADDPHSPPYRLALASNNILSSRQPASIGLLHAPANPPSGVSGKRRCCPGLRAMRHSHPLLPSLLQSLIPGIPIHNPILSIQQLCRRSPRGCWRQ